MFNVQNYKDKISLLEENIKTLKEKLEVAERSYVQRDREATFFAEENEVLRKRIIELENIEIELKKEYEQKNETLLQNLNDCYQREDSLLLQNHELKDIIKQNEIKIKSLTHANQSLIDKKVDFRLLKESDSDYWEEVNNNGLVRIEEHTKVIGELSKLHHQYYDLERDYNALRRKYIDLEDK